MQSLRSGALTVGALSLGTALVAITGACSRDPKQGPAPVTAQPPAALPTSPGALPPGAGVLPAGASSSAVAAARCLLASGAPVPSSARPVRPGGTIALAPDETTAAVADTDNDAVVMLAVDAAGARVANRFTVGRGPTQVALGSDGRVFVTEKLANSVAVFDSRDGRLLCRAQVAQDPAGVALSPDERTVYVTSGLAHTLTALDAATFAVRGAVDVPREPRGIAVTPDGARAFLSHLAGQPLSQVALASAGAGMQVVPVPAAPIPPDRNSGMLGARTTSLVGFASREPIGFGRRDVGLRGPGLAPPGVNTAVTVNPLPSQAWAVALDAASGKVFVPFMVSRTGREIPREVRLDAYGGGSVSVENDNEKVSFAIGTFDIASGQWTNVALPGANRNAFHRGFRGLSPAQGGTTGAVRIPSAVAVRPGSGSGPGLVVASMGTGEVAEVSLASAAAAAVNGANRDRRGTPVGIGVGPTGASRRASPGTSLATARTVDTPCGVVVTSSGAELVYSMMEHSVEHRGAAGATRVAIGTNPLPQEIALGRRLFHTANDARLSSGGLSCGGCHPDGRDDGLTWFLSHGPRQTPTLAGRLILPFNWNGTARTMEANVSQTVHRLGGSGLSMMEVDAIAAYVQRGIAAPDGAGVQAAGVAAAGDRSAQAARGRELFMGQAGCNTCHDPGRNFTDGQVHELGGLGPDESERTFDTPSLRYVAATAPYFHDGRYPTLRAMLLDPTHRMGRVEGLSAADVDAMVAYLETL